MQGRPAHLVKGADAEKRAAALLRDAGYRIIDRNCSYKFGELDIVAEAGDQRLFVEVKYRNTRRYGEAAEFVNPGKQRRLTRAALRWIQQRDPQMHFAYRFDVITIQGKSPGEQKIDWIKNAFEVNY